MFTCDTGGELNKVTHFYSYESMMEREAARKVAAQDPQWAAYVDAGRNYMQKQVSAGTFRQPRSLSTQNIWALYLF